MAAAINYDYLRASVQREGIGAEGKSRHTGYVPDDDSGVTIGVGFDIGQHNEWELNKIFPDNPKLVEKLKDYTKLEGDEARKVAKDLTVSGKDYIDVIVKPINYKIDRIVKKYNEKAGRDAFQNLEPELQRTIFGVVYQMGTGDFIETSDFWKQATSKDWTGMLNNMQSNGWGKTQARRTEELDILLKSGAVQRQFVYDIQNKENFLSD